MDEKKTSNTQEWLAQRFPTVFELDSYLGLVNTSRFKPQTTYEKILIVWMIFSSNFAKSFLMSAIYSFLK